MAELFYKFDQDGSGTLDLHELCDLFKSAGLKVPSKKLKDMFRLTNAIKHNKDDLSVEDFQKLMLSPVLDRAFRELLFDIR